MEAPVSEILVALLRSTLDAGPALVFASLGAVVSERAGIINVGVEGMMRAGALSAAVVALVLPTPLGIVAGMAAGACLGLVHGWLCVRLRADQVVSGMAINLVMLALGTFLLEAFFSPSGTPSIRQLERGLWGVGPLSYLAIALPFALHFALSKTVWGLRVKAVGEKPSALAVTGVSVARLRLTCVAMSGALAGLGGAALSTTVLDRFEHHMPAGMGFMAVAAMVFGRWTPLGAAGAAAFFSFGNAVRIGLQTSAPEVLETVPAGVLLAFPYALTLLALAFQQPNMGTAPASLGRPHDGELRA